CTRGWPVMRRAVRRLGAELVAQGSLEAASEIHFLTRNEVLTALAGKSLKPPVSARRERWERQRRLSPPLTVGPVAPMVRRMLDDFVESANSPSSANGIRGMASSPGRRTGPVRIIRDATEFGLLVTGEVLVAPVCTP